jgi:hypothetical protein
MLRKKLTVVLAATMMVVMAASPACGGISSLGG